MEEEIIKLCVSHSQWIVKKEFSSLLPSQSVTAGSKVWERTTWHLNLYKFNDNSDNGNSPW